MRIHILTLFPNMFDGVLTDSMIGKAQDKNIVSIHTVNFRDYANNKHMTVDDSPYGGGGGMVLKPEPIFNAVDSLPIDWTTKPKPRVILLCPQGERYTQSKAESLANEQELVFICGHYEGYDERIRQHLVTDEISIGDYVLTGGEIAAMAVIDSVVRLLPGVLGNELSAVSDSFSTGLLEHPHYTRPAIYREWPVPDVLVSGHHMNVEEWRHRESLRRTWLRRPDLLQERELTSKQLQWLQEFRDES
jgi:tRNA (guanine37-N1)-methyltransferase